MLVCHIMASTLGLEQMLRQTFTFIRQRHFKCLIVNLSRYVCASYTSEYKNKGADRAVNLYRAYVMCTVLISRLQSLFKHVSCSSWPDEYLDTCPVTLVTRYVARCSFEGLSLIFDLCAVLLWKVLIIQLAELDGNREVPYIHSEFCHV